MHNIHELEKRWLNYKIKSYLPHAGATIVAIGLLISIYQTITSPKIKEEKIVIKEIEKPVEKKVIKKESEPIILVEPKKEIIQDLKQKPKEIVQINKKQENKKLILEPSLDFVKKLRISSINTYEPQKRQTNVTKKQVVKTNKTNKTNKTISKQNTKAKNTQEKVKKTQKISINLKRQETIDDINHVIKRFKNNHNPALSLFVAKKYYKLGDYHKAYNYALITNNINREIDTSWVIFAKSLVKLNKKNKAIETLKTYIEQSNSNTAKMLLNDIKLGKFK